MHAAFLMPFKPSRNWMLTSRADCLGWLRACILGCAIVCCLTNTGRSDFVVAVDFDPVTSGIQDSLNVLPGEAFTAYLVLEFNDPLGLDSYSFSVDYEVAGMNATASMDILPSGFQQTGSGSPQINAPTVAPFAAESINIGAGPVTISSITVGTINFVAGASPGTFSITPYIDPVFDGAFDNGGAPLTNLSFQTGSVIVAAVPEPTTLAKWLLPLLAWRRCRRYYFTHKLIVAK